MFTSVKLKATLICPDLSILLLQVSTVIIIVTSTSTSYIIISCFFNTSESGVHPSAVHNDVLIYQTLSEMGEDIHLKDHAMTILLMLRRSCFDDTANIDSDVECIKIYIIIYAACFLQQCWWCLQLLDNTARTWWPAEGAGRATAAIASGTERTWTWTKDRAQGTSGAATSAWCWL